MSSILDKLLKGQKVEWLPIENIFNLKNGYTPSKSNQSYWKDGTIPWFRLEDIRENGNILSSALQQVSESAVKGKKIFPKNSFIIATSATIGEHALITVPYLANQRFTNLSLKDEFAESFNIIFLYYYLFKLDDWCKNNTTMSSFAAVDMNGFRKFEIPIPPLDVQAKIVKILDAFTVLTAELTAELTMRETQYNYYRDKLLTFSDDEVEWKSLGDISNFTNGKGHEKDISELGRFIVVNSKFISTEGKVAKYTEKQICPIFKDDILIVMSDLPNGKALAKTFFVEEDDKYSLNQRIGKLSVNDNSKMNPKFLHYFLNRNKQLTKYDNGADQTNLRKDQILGVKIPIIPLNEQKRIVDILDKFETITKSITEGLPKEISLRQQQYEYYREQLLDFPKE